MLKFFVFLLICVGSMFAKEFVRKSAVAGSFYPLSKDSLNEVLSEFIDGGNGNNSPKVIIVPHAGYVFSGRVAGAVYSKISPNIKNIIILAPAHRVYFHGLSVPSFSHYETPLGKIKINSDMRSKFFSEFPNSSHDDAHIEEHSIEVQLPFLQKIISNFTILPILICDYYKILKLANFLDKISTDETLIVISSDLSHYKELSDANITDKKTIKTIESLNSDGFIDACGSIPIRVAIEFAKIRGLKPTVIAHSNSYTEAPNYCSIDRVVGYASFEFVKETEALNFTDEEKRELLSVARKSIVASLLGEVESEQLIDSSEKLNQNHGCFVTLSINDSLRGCIGYIEPIKPLITAVKENAKNAALNDPRFNPVAEGELDKIKIEISVLTKPVDIKFSSSEELLSKIEPFVDGIILEHEFSRSTFLPQVWEKLPDKIDFLRNLSVKAGLSPDAWHSASFKKYRVIHFSE